MTVPFTTVCLELNPVSRGHGRGLTLANADTGLILGLPPANGRRRYKVTPSLIGWTQT